MYNRSKEWELFKFKFNFTLYYKAAGVANLNVNISLAGGQRNKLPKCPIKSDFFANDLRSRRASAAPPVSDLIIKKYLSPDTRGAV